MLATAHKDRGVVFATIDDAEHFDAETRAKIIASYQKYELEARTKGIPTMGSGRIFPIEEAAITVAPFPIPAHWPQINGVDFGYDHPFGAVNCAWDRDADCFYVCKEYREREATPLTHSGALKPWGEWVPTAWPHDGLQHDKGGSCEELASQYRNLGIKMLSERATFEDGGNGVEAGLLDMLTRMQTGRWKVFASCGTWLSEFRLYHRKDGKVVKISDDVISASRYALMMKRHAEVHKVQAWKQAGTGWVV